MKYRCLLCLLFCVSVSSLFCERKIDSLETLLKTAGDTAKIRLLNQIALEHSNNGSQETARLKARTALNLAIKLQKPNQLIDCYNALGLIEYNIDNNEEALKLFNKALEVCKENDLTEAEAVTEDNIGNTYYFMNEFLEATKAYRRSEELFSKAGLKQRTTEPLDMLATCYYQQNDYESALQTHMSSLKIKEENKQEKTITFSYLGIGNIYYQKKDYANALKYYGMCEDFAEKKNQNYELGRAYNNMGRVYIDLNKPDQANKYNLLGLEAKEKNDPNDPEIINSLENIGSYYLQKKNFDSASYFIYRALSLSRKLGAAGNEAESLTSLSAILIQTGKPEMAIDSLNVACKIARELKALSLVRSIYEQLAQAYLKKEDYKSAFSYQEKFSILGDSILNEENTRSMNEIMVKFDTEKKEQEIADLNKQKRLQKIITISVASGLLIVLVLSFFLFRSFKATQLAKKAVEEQKHLVEEKNEEITSSIVYARRIQRAILPEENILNQAIPEHFIIYKPKDIVSGDFYWMSDFPDHSFFAVADCTGHGVPGSLMSMMGVNLLNQITSHHPEYNPNEVLSELDRQLKKALHLSEGKTDKTADGMDIALLKFNKNTAEIQYAGANRSLILLSNGVLTEIKATKKAIGGDTDLNLFQFQNHTLQLNKADMIYLSSDGYADQFGGPNNKKMTTSRMKSKLTEVSVLSVQEQGKILDAFFEEWKGGTEQTDDILLAGIKMR